MEYTIVYNKFDLPNYAEQRNIKIQHKYQNIIKLIKLVHHKYGDDFNKLIPYIIYHMSMDLPLDIQQIYKHHKYYNNIYIITINDRITYNIKKIIDLILDNPYIGSTYILQIYSYITNISNI